MPAKRFSLSPCSCLLRRAVAKDSVNKCTQMLIHWVDVGRRFSGSGRRFDFIARDGGRSHANVRDASNGTEQGHRTCDEQGAVRVDVNNGGGHQEATDTLGQGEAEGGLPPDLSVKPGADDLKRIGRHERQHARRANAHKQ